MCWPGGVCSVAWLALCSCSCNSYWLLLLSFFSEKCWAPMKWRDGPLTFWDASSPRQSGPARSKTGGTESVNATVFLIYWTLLWLFPLLFSFCFLLCVLSLFSSRSQCCDYTAELKSAFGRHHWAMTVKAVIILPLSVSFLGCTYCLEQSVKRYNCKKFWNSYHQYHFQICSKNSSVLTA